MIAFYVLLIIIQVKGEKSGGYSVIKEIDGLIYIGGMNSLSSFSLLNQTLTKIQEEYYSWPHGIMNGSDIGSEWIEDRWPANFSRGPKTLAFDNCLNWKQEHKNASVRDSAYDYPRWFYYTPSGDFETMNHTCQNSFIKAILPLDNDRLWVCGTFGAFPRAFSVNKTTLKFLEFVDTNVMSCARYQDEPMATFVNNVTKERYVATGWGLYRPAATKPDVLNNNSTLLLSQWRMYRNLFTTQSEAALVLSSDVNFIDVVKETENHIYFFGYEINSQYGLNNQDDRNAWQSFMLRICKSDLGYKYVSNLNLENSISLRYLYVDFNNQDYKISPSRGDVDYLLNMPTKHFVTSMKVNFGCYISKRPRAISDNQFWGETNVIYLNKLADVHFDPNRKLRFVTRNVNNVTGCNESPHSQIPLLGLFNGPGIAGTALEPSGALCQLQINENIFVDKGSKRKIYDINNYFDALDAFDELMATSSTSVSNFFDKNLYRTNGFTLYPWWNQGVMIGRSNAHRDSYKEVFHDVGKCHDKDFYDKLDTNRFWRIQNFTNTAWPNDLPNRFTSFAQSICQYYVAELYNFNATFIVPGVQFKKLFVIADNITDYEMHSIRTEKLGTFEKKLSSPLMVVGIISTSGIFYRVVLCDFDNGIANYGHDHRSGSWYNWCIFRHTNQPYLYRQYAPMENRTRGEAILYRASSLLLEKKIVSPEDEASYPINRDPQFHVVKGALRKGDYLHVVTTNNIHKVSLKAECSNYLSCVECASDPFCMWNIGAKACKIYVEKYVNTGFVQDVLDRGYKCANYLKNSEAEKVPENTQVLHCRNSAFWRGKIIWKKNNKDISNTSEYKIVNGNTLIIYHINNKNNDFKDGDNISCHGVKDDYDKLYGGAEYDWISYHSNLENVHLNTFIAEWSNTINVLGVLLSVLAVVCLILIIIIILLYLEKKNGFSVNNCKNGNLSEDVTANEVGMSSTTRQMLITKICLFT